MYINFIGSVPPKNLGKYRSGAYVGKGRLAPGKGVKEKMEGSGMEYSGTELALEISEVLVPLRLGFSTAGGGGCGGGGYNICSQGDPPACCLSEQPPGTSLSG